MGQVVPVEITVYEDRSFTFITKTPPAAFLLKEAAGLEKGSGEPNRQKVGTVSRSQVEEIARTKMRSEEHTSELQSRQYLVCRLLLEKKKKTTHKHQYIIV